MAIRHFAPGGCVSWDDGERGRGRGRGEDGVGACFARRYLYYCSFGGCGLGRGRGEDDGFYGVWYYGFRVAG